MPRNQTNRRRHLPVVLGGGAMRGAALPGFLKYLEERKVAFRDLYCVSIGSVVGALYANGYTPEEITEIFAEELGPRGVLHPLVRALLPPLNPLRWLFGGLVDLAPIMEHICEKYRLQPRKSLHIIAYDALNFEGVIFEGTDYDLPQALVASCSVPGLFRPLAVNVLGRHRVLLDYGVVHPHPTSFCGSEAIVAKLFHSNVVDMLWPDKPEQFTVNAGNNWMPPFVVLTKGSCEDNFALGYSRAKQALGDHIDSGAIDTWRRRPTIKKAA